MIRVCDLDILCDLEVAGRYLTTALFRQADDSFVLIVQNDRNTLEVEEDIDDIFLNTFNGAVLMKHTFYLHFSNRTPRHRGEQDPAQRVAEGMSETTL